MIMIERLSKSFRPAGRRTAEPVLRGVSLDVPRGCLYGLIGPGAAGKSVLLKMITGLLKPDGGRIVVDGQDVTDASELELQKFRLKFGMLFQNNALFDYMTVGENIAFPLRRLSTCPRTRSASRRRAAQGVAPPGLRGAHALGPLGRPEEARRRRARDDLAGADRPLRRAGGGPRSGDVAAHLRAPARRAARGRRDRLMVSSDLDRLLTVTDRVGMLYRGALIFDGTTEEAQTSAEPHVRQFVHGLTDGPL